MPDEYYDVPDQENQPEQSVATEQAQPAAASESPQPARPITGPQTAVNPQAPGFVPYPWPAVEGHFRAAFPNLDPEAMRTRYEHARQLAIARQSVQETAQAEQQSFSQQPVLNQVEQVVNAAGRFVSPATHVLNAITGRQETPHDAPLTDTAMRNFLPVGSQVIQHLTARDVDAARQRVAEGKPEPNDYVTIAQQEQRERTEAERSTAGKIGMGLGRGAAMVGEMALGGALLRGASALRGLGFLAAPAAEAGTTFLGRAGAALTNPASWARGAAQTAVVPSIYMPNVRSANRAMGLPDTDWRGAPIGFAVGMAQNAVFGAVGGSPAAPGLRDPRAFIPTAQRMFEGVARGMVAQQGLDIGESVIEDVAQRTIGHGFGLETRYGTLGRFARAAAHRSGDELDQALGHLVVQATIFSAFSAFHEASNRPRPEVQGPRYAPPDAPGGPSGPTPSLGGPGPRPSGGGPAGGGSRPRSGTTFPELMEATQAYVNAVHGSGQGRRGASLRVNATVKGIQEVIATAFERGWTPEMVRDQLRDRFPRGAERTYADAFAAQYERTIQSRGGPRPAQENPPPDAEPQPQPQPASNVARPQTPALEAPPAAPAPTGERNVSPAVQDAPAGQPDAANVPRRPPSTVAADMGAMQRDFGGRLGGLRRQQTATPEALGLAVPRPLDIQARETVDRLMNDHGINQQLAEAAVNRVITSAATGSEPPNWERSGLRQRRFSPEVRRVLQELDQRVRAEQTATVRTERAAERPPARAIDEASGVADLLERATRTLDELRPTAENAHVLAEHRTNLAESNHEIQTAIAEGAEVGKSPEQVQRDLDSRRAELEQAEKDNGQTPAAAAPAPTPENPVPTRPLDAEVRGRFGGGPTAERGAGGHGEPRVAGGTRLSRLRAKQRDIAASPQPGGVQPVRPKRAEKAHEARVDTLPGLWDRIRSPEANVPEVQTAINALAKLTPSEARVLWARLPESEGGQGMTLEQVADLIGVSQATKNRREWPRQLERRARAKVGRPEASAAELAKQAEGAARDQSALAGRHAGFVEEGFHTADTPPEPADHLQDAVVRLMEEAVAAGKPITGSQLELFTENVNRIAKEIENENTTGRRSLVSAKAIEAALRSGLQAGTDATTREATRNPNAPSASEPVVSPEQGGADAGPAERSPSRRLTRKPKGRSGAITIPTKELASANDYFQEQIIDSLHALKRLKAEGEKKGVKYAVGQDPETLYSRLMHADAETAGQWEQGGVWTLQNGKRAVIGPSLGQIIAPLHPTDLEPYSGHGAVLFSNPGEISKAEVFAVARHLVDEFSRGRTPAPPYVRRVAEQLMADFAADPAFVARATAFHDLLTKGFNATILALGSPDIHFLNQGDARNVIAKSPTYISLGRDVEGWKKTGFMSGRTASGALIVPPFLNYRKRLQVASALMNEQIRRSSVAQYLLQPGMEDFGVEVSAPKGPPPGAAKATEALKAMGVVDADIDAFLSEMGPHAIAYFTNTPWVDRGDNTVSWKGPGGTPIVFRVNDKSLYNLMTDMQTDASRVATFYKTMANLPGLKQISAIVREGATVASMGFQFRNALTPWRDPYEFFKNTIDRMSLATLPASLARAYAYEFAVATGKIPKDVVFGLFLRERGQDMRRFTFDRNKPSDVYDVVRPKKGLVQTLQNTAQIIRGWLEFAGAGELGPRFHEFLNRMKQLGYTDAKLRDMIHRGEEVPWYHLQAGMEAANEVTTPFNRVGAQSREVNRTTPFFGPAVAGLGKAFRNMKNNPKGFALALSAYLTARLLQWLMYKDDPEYQELSPRDKYVNFAIKIPGLGFWRMPGARDIEVPVGGTLVASLEAAAGRDPHFADLTWESLDANLPPTPIPTPATITLQLARNRDFAGRLIVPRADENLPETTINVRHRIPYAITQATGGRGQLVEPLFGGGRSTTESVIRGLGIAPAARIRNPAQSVRDVNELLHQLKGERELAARGNQPFAREAEYQHLNAASRQIGEISAQMAGRQRALSGRMVQGPEPSEERQAELNAARVAIARNALRAVREAQRKR